MFFRKILAVLLQLHFCWCSETFVFQRGNSITASGQEHGKTEYWKLYRGWIERECGLQRRKLRGFVKTDRSSGQGCPLCRGSHIWRCRQEQEGSRMEDIPDCSRTQWRGITLVSYYNIIPYLIFSWTSGQENKSCGKNCKDLITNFPCCIETWAKRQIFDRMWMKSRTSCTEPSTLWRCPTGQVDHSLDPGPDKHSSPLKLSDSRIFTPRASWT